MSSAATNIRLWPALASVNSEGWWSERRLDLQVPEVSGPTNPPVATRQLLKPVSVIPLLRIPTQGKQTLPTPTLSDICSFATELPCPVLLHHRIIRHDSGLDSFPVSLSPRAWDFPSHTVAALLQPLSQRTHRGDIKRNTLREIEVRHLLFGAQQGCVGVLTPLCPVLW